MLHREPRSACNGSAGFVAHCATASACHRSAIQGPTGLAMVGNSQAAIVGRGKEWLALEFPDLASAGAEVLRCHRDALRRLTG